MIDVADANAAYYYHYDALGSVVALSDSAGDTVQVYDYDVYGQVASYPPDDTNPFLFTGRRYDTETGLYYYRARYYNASIGRFLQTDPIGYGDGMNWYGYCGNNPLGFSDPFGMKASEEAGGTGFSLVPDTEFGDSRYFYLVITEDGEEVDRILLENLNDAVMTLMDMDSVFSPEWMKREHEGAWTMASYFEETFWSLLIINELGGGFNYDAMATLNVLVDYQNDLSLGGEYANEKEAYGETPSHDRGVIVWGLDVDWIGKEEEPLWSSMSGGDLALLAHELQHAKDRLLGADLSNDAHEGYSETNAITVANTIRSAIVGLTPGAFGCRGDPPRHTVDDYMRPGGWGDGARRPAPWKRR
jgi:RHS repeat-associated protein